MKGVKLIMSQQHRKDQGKEESMPASQGCKPVLATTTLIEEIAKARQALAFCNTARASVGVDSAAILPALPPDKEEVR